MLDSRIVALALAVSLAVPALAQVPAPAAQFAQVRGVLLTAEGLPASGYQLALRNRTGDLFTSGPTGPDGAFSVVQLPPDNYRLVALSPDGTEFPVLGREVELRAGQVERIELRLGAPSGAPGRAATAKEPAGAGGGGTGAATAAKKGGGWWAGLSTGMKIAIVTGGIFVGGLAASQLGDDDDSNPPASQARP